MKFVHLHNHTHYSMLDAAATVDDLIMAAQNYGHDAIALTDHGVMFGALEFYHKAKKKGIKPIIGFEAYLATGSRFDKSSGKTKKKNYYHLLLLAKDYHGYKNLVKLTTLAHLEGFYYKPRIDKELLEKYHEGIIACSGCINGVLNAHIIKGDIEKAKKEAKYFKDLFGDDFYIELQNHFLPEDDMVLQWAPQIANEFGIKLVATNDVHYIKKEHAIAHNVYLNIKSASEGVQNIDILNLRYRSDQLYYKSTEEMVELFKQFPESIENTVEIADKSNIELKKGIFMPEFKIPEDSKAKDLDEYLRELTYKNLKEKFKTITQEIKERADYELDVICKMKFSGYFLIVSDFVNAARKMGVRIGPGRGSAAGSIVAYALGITSIDPIKYGLLFERFLNPDRVSMPDIDIDFSDDKRDLVIDYVKKKYGENCVAQIITFGKLSSRAVLKDVGRILGIPHQEINKITSKIPVVLGKVPQLNEALELPELAELKNSKDPLYKQLIEYSLLLEGLYRHTSVHAAGIVITPKDVSEFVPLFVQKVDNEDRVEIVTQYSMNDLEAAGLVKMDFLGLRTLSIIDETLSMIYKNHNVKIDIDNINFDDSKTFELFSQAKTLGVFQFESSGMQEYLRQLKPTSILELSDMNALYRPGPLQHIPEYIDRKFGRKKIEYLHPLMENSLKSTYGIIVYQEQVMQLARDIAGFTLAQADNLRRAMGKKKADVMTKMKPEFIEGAKRTNGISEKVAGEIFDLIEKFANYGFNKSHSLAYAILAYQTAYLKAHYPAEFFAANLNAEINNSKQIPKLIEDAKSFGIEILPPDINRSFARFVALNSEKILFGLAGIKNVGTRVEETIVKARNEKPFTSFYNFVMRVDPKVVNRKVLEALVCTGAFDTVENGKRATLFHAIDSALEFSKKIHDHSIETDSSLFGELQTQNDIVVEPSLPNVTEWDFRERLAREKSFLNFYFSGHPLEKYRTIIKVLSNIDLGNLGEYQNFSSVRLVGTLLEIDTKIDKNKQKYAFATLEDFRGKAELVIWSEAYARFQHLLDNDRIVFVTGKGEIREESILKVYVSELYTVGEALQKFVDSIHIYLKDDEKSLEKLYNFASICNSPRTSTKVLFILRNNGERKAFVADSVNLLLNEDNLSKIFEIFGEDFVKLIPKSF